jgi:hypothetical protein
VAGLLLLALTLFGCAGGSFNGTTYRDSEFAFRLGPVPAGVRRIDTDEALLAFRDDQASSTIAVSARCGKDGDDVPLEALVTHLFIRFTDRETISERRFRLAGRAALEVEMKARLDGVPSHFVITVLKRDGCVYDFIHIDAGGNDPRTLQSRKDFRSMVQGFSVLD